MPSLIKLITKTYQMAAPHERKVVLDNVASLSVLQTITYILPVIILPYLFRIIGPEKFGLIAFAQAFVQYFMILTDYGFNVSATKEISLCHNQPAKIAQAFSAVMTVKIALALVSLLIFGLTVYFIPKFREDWLVYALSFGAVVGNTLFPLWFFQGMEKMKHIANLNIIGGFIYALLILLFVRKPEDYLAIPIINSCVPLIIALLGQHIVFRTFKVTFKVPTYAQIRQQLEGGWDIFISIAAINAYTTTRVFVVGLLTNNTTTGFYSIAEKIANLCQTFPLASFSQAIFPRLSKIFHRNKIKALVMMQHIQQITVRIAFFCLPLIYICSDFIVSVVCGGDYPQTVLSLRLLLIAVFFVSANAFRVQFLLVCGKTDLYSKIHVTMALIGLPLIFLFAYSFSYIGVAVATVLIEAGIFTITYFVVKGVVRELNKS